MAGLKNVLNRIFSQNSKKNVGEEYAAGSSYSPVPFTLALRKRKYEEEQFSKYGLHKEKMYDIH